MFNNIYREFSCVMQSVAGHNNWKNTRSLFDSSSSKHSYRSSIGIVWTDYTKWYNNSTASYCPGESTLPGPKLDVQSNTCLADSSI